MRHAAAVLVALCLAPAATAADGYSYPGLRQNVNAATVSITAAHLAPQNRTGTLYWGHVAVWVGAQDATRRNWIQAGVLYDTECGLCTYVETGTNGVHTIRRLRPVKYGQRIRVRLVAAHGQWIARLDGATVGRTQLRGDVTRVATAERLRGTLRYQLTPG